MPCSCRTCSLGGGQGCSRRFDMWYGCPLVGQCTNKVGGKAGRLCAASKCKDFWRSNCCCALTIDNRSACICWCDWRLAQQAATHLHHTPAQVPVGAKATCPQKTHARQTKDAWNNQQAPRLSLSRPQGTCAAASPRVIYAGLAMVKLGQVL
jgi:hypothetical protein